MEIANATMQTAKKVMHDVKYGYPKKKIFPVRGNHRQRRAIKEKAKALLPIDIFSGAIQLAQIIAKPVPRYPENKASSVTVECDCSNVRQEVVQMTKGQFQLITSRQFGKTLAFEEWKKMNENKILACTDLVGRAKAKEYQENVILIERLVKNE